MGTNEMKCELLYNVIEVDGFKCLSYIDAEGDDVVVHNIMNIGGVHVDISSEFTVYEDADYDLAVEKIWQGNLETVENKCSEVISLIVSSIEENGD